MLGDGRNVVLVKLSPLRGRLFAIVLGRVNTFRRSVPEQTFNHLALIVGDLGITLQPLGVDDG